MPVLTPRLGLSKPIIDGDDDVWGDFLNDNADILDAQVMRPADVAALYLPLAGGTMTGSLLLKANAAAPLEAVTLQQLTGGYLPLTGGTLSGALTLRSVMPAANYEATPKLYVDNGLAAKIGDAPADNQYWVRRNNAWALSPGGMLDAPSDGFSYMRLNGAWSSGGLLSSGLTVNGAFSAVASRTPAGLIVDTRGNVGIGYVPPAAQAQAAASAGGWSFQWGITANNWAWNGYYDGSVWHYLTDGMWMQQTMGPTQMLWQSAPSGAKDAVVAAPATLMSLDTGSLSVAAAVYAGALMQSGNGRFISMNSGNNASFSCWDTSQNYAAGMFLGAGSILYLAQMDGGGNYIGPNWFASFDPGGTMNVKGNIITANAVQGGYIHSTGGVMADDGHFYIGNNTSYWMGRQSSDGIWYIVNNGSVLTSTDTAGTFRAVGHVIAGAALYAAGENIWLGNGGSGRVMQFQSNWYWDWNSSNGVLQWVAGGNINLVLNPDGYLRPQNGVLCPGNRNNPDIASLNGALILGGNSIPIGSGGAAGYIILNGGARPSYAVEFYWLATRFWMTDTGGNTWQNGQCFATAYPGPSDRRLKRNIQPWTTRGLRDVRALEPVSFEWNGERGLHADGSTHYGLIAQDAQAVFPEAITEMQSDAFAPTAEHKSEAPLLAWDNGVLNMAMINAIKELATRVEALESAT